MGARESSLATSRVTENQSQLHHGIEMTDIWQVFDFHGLLYSQTQHEVWAIATDVSSQRVPDWKGCDTSHKLSVIWKPFDVDALRTPIKRMMPEI
jgi:hypothetical protein